MGLAAFTSGNLTLVPPFTLIFGIKLGVNSLAGTFLSPIETILVGSEAKELLMVVVVSFKG